MPLLSPRPRTALILALLACGVASGGPRADVVYLENGRRLEGEVTRDPETGDVSVRRAGVVIRLESGEIARIEEAETPAARFRARLEATDPEDLEALVELAHEAREEHLGRGLDEVSRRILEIDPNHLFARRQLGYVVFENRWVLEKDLRSREGLVEWQGEWMREEERARRELVAAREKLDDLFESVRSSNRYVQEYAVQRLMAWRHPQARALLAERLDDPDEVVRMVAVSALTNFPARGDEPDDDAEARAITARLFRRVLAEDAGQAEREALYLALRRLQPRESFRLALKRLRTADPARRSAQRAGEVAFRVLRKAWVPELIRALRGPEDEGDEEAPAVRAVLVRALDVDHGFDVERWLAWWDAHRERFRDAP